MVTTVELTTSDEESDCRSTVDGATQDIEKLHIIVTAARFSSRRPQTQSIPQLDLDATPQWPSHRQLHGDRRSKPRDLQAPTKWDASALQSRVRRGLLFQLVLPQLVLRHL